MSFRSAWALTLLALGACVDRVAATQLMLRIQDPEQLRDDLKALRVEHAVLRKEGWSERAPLQLSPDEIANWPVDVSIQAQGEDIRAKIEVVVSLLGKSGQIRAQARVISSFVPHQARALPIVLRTCTGHGPNGICLTDESCHGSKCLTCIEAECEPTPESPGQTLDAFAPDAAITELEPIVTESDAGEPPFDAGDLDADGDEAVADDSADGMDGGADDGSMEAEVEAEVPTEAEVPIDVGPDTAAECTADEIPRCAENGRDIQVCKNGSWAIERDCEHACVAGRCVDCKPADRRCDPQNAYAPQLCNAEGYWRLDIQETATGECVGICEEGRCRGECRGANTFQCSSAVDNMRQECVQNRWTDRALCPNFCRAAECITPPSCRVEIACTSNVSCCNARSLPGGTFSRSYDGVGYTDKSFGATLAPFKLDRFEVTVARFRRWVDAFPGSIPKVGDGKNPHNPADTGWQTSWSELLGTDKVKLLTNLACDSALSTWRPSPDANDNKPMNCVDWYMSQAFCIWDGGRLPSEAEWNYASAGGEEQRVYPFSRPPSSIEIDARRAVFGDQSLAAVGSRSDGESRWGHSDLAGNIAEWVQDQYFDPYAYLNCDNCSDMTAGACKVYRGGGAGLPEDMATSSYRDCLPPLLRHGKVGFRCARN